jgi:hypothetical protein
MPPIYVHATIKIRIGGYGRFCEVMAKQVPILEACGWKLLGAWSTQVGPICTIIDLWELPDANAFFEGKAKWVEDPIFAEFRAMSTEIMIEEMVTMANKVPYSP